MTIFMATTLSFSLINRSPLRSPLRRHLIAEEQTFLGLHSDDLGRMLGSTLRQGIGLLQCSVVTV